VNDVYQQVCVWVVTISGSLVLFGFATFFVHTVWTRLMAKPEIRVEARPASTPAQPVTRLCRACSGALGPVESLELTDGGARETRTCQVCHETQLVPR
jgi:hypothetical protein